MCIILRPCEYLRWDSKVTFTLRRQSVYRHLWSLIVTSQRSYSSEEGMLQRLSSSNSLLRIHSQQSAQKIKRIAFHIDAPHIVMEGRSRCQSLVEAPSTDFRVVVGSLQLWPVVDGRESKDGEDLLALVRLSLKQTMTLLERDVSPLQASLLRRRTSPADSASWQKCSLSPTSQ